MSTLQDFKCHTISVYSENGTVFPVTVPAEASVSDLRTAILTNYPSQALDAKDVTILFKMRPLRDEQNLQDMEIGGDDFVVAIVSNRNTFRTPSVRTGIYKKFYSLAILPYPTLSYSPLITSHISHTYTYTYLSCLNLSYF